MSISASLRQFSDDQRAVSAVIGFILIFGILMLTLTIYQAQIVPQQNAQTEFTHFEETRDDMVDFRSAVSSAGQSDRSQFPTIQLGTVYQTRLVTINPPPPSGTLQTSEPYDIKIDGEPSVPTRFLEYQPRYNELTTGSVWYENSVVYYDDQDEQVIIEDQSLVTGDERLRITALQNELDETGTDTLTVELYPTETSDIDFDELEEENGDVEITIPTRLDDHWNETLTADFDDSDFSINNDGTYPNGVFALNITVDVENIHINTVGIRSEPNQDTARNIDRDQSTGDNDNGDNPPELDENKKIYAENDANVLVEDIKEEDVLFEGADSTFTVEADDEEPADMEGIVRFDEDGGAVTIDSSDEEIATSQGEIFMRDNSEVNLEGTDEEKARVEDNIRIGDDSEIDSYASEITGDVEVGDDSDVRIESNDEEDSVIQGSLTYRGDGKLELVDTDEENSQINGQVIIEDEDSTVTFDLEDSSVEFDDLEVVDGDGNELDEDDDQVDLIT